MLFYGFIISISINNLIAINQRKKSDRIETERNETYEFVQNETAQSAPNPVYEHIN